MPRIKSKILHAHHSDSTVRLSSNNQVVINTKRYLNVLSKYSNEPELIELRNVLEQGILLKQPLKRKTLKKSSITGSFEKKAILKDNKLIEEKDSDEMMSVKETAALFGVSDAAVYKWIEQSKIEFISKGLGKTYQIPKKQFAAILDTQRKIDASHKKLFNEEVNSEDLDYTDRSDLLR